MLRVYATIYNRFREWEWKRYKKKRRWRLKNENFTIIASNCSGMFMYYDLGLEYLTPTVNLSMDMNDFVKMVGNLEWYMNQIMVDAQADTGCPVGILGDIRINFIHYDSFEEGFHKWEERKRRINWDNLFIVGSEQDGCSYETIRNFDRLPYKNKVIFTHVEYPEFSSAYCIKGFKKKTELGTITNYKKQILKRRYLDAFDYISFLNNGIRERGSSLGV